MQFYVVKWHGGCSFRLGLGGLALGLALLVALDAGAGNSAAHGEGEVTTPKAEQRKTVSEQTMLKIIS